MSFSYPSAGWTRRPPHCVFVVAATLILTTAAALTACTPATTAPDDGPAGVSASVVQDRTQIATGTMSVEVHNDGSDPFVVTSMDYADPRLAGAVTWSGTLTVPSGSKRDVSFSVPSPVCDAGDSGQTGHVRLSFKADAEQATADYPVEDPYGFVASHLATACFSATLAQHASVTLTDVTTAGAGGTEIAVMHVQVTVTGDDAVRIESAESTTLLQPEVGGWMWPIDTTVQPGTSRTIDLRTIPARCDPHAIAEDKVGTRFDTSVTILSDPAVTGMITLAADDAAKSALFDYVTRLCGNQS